MDPAEAMTIDELARRAGVTTRNIRAYQTRGLLPPPQVVGRVGQYDGAHLARLSYISQLRHRGFSLAAIQEVLGGWDDGRSLSDVLGFEEALTAPWTDDGPEELTRSELEAMFPEIARDERLLHRAVDLGLVVPKGDRFEAPRARTVRVGAELVAAGLPLSAVLDAHVELTSDMERIAARLVRLFETHVWEPFVAAGLPVERLPEVTQALQRVRPTASAAVLAAFAGAMEGAVRASAAEQAARFAPACPRHTDEDAHRLPAASGATGPGLRPG